MEKPGLEPPPPAFPNKGLIEAGPALGCTEPSADGAPVGQKSRGHRLCTRQDGSSFCRAPTAAGWTPCPEAAWWAPAGS